MFILSQVPLPRNFESPVSTFYRCCKANGFKTAKELRCWCKEYSCSMQDCVWREGVIAKLITTQKFLTPEEAMILTEHFLHPLGTDTSQATIYRTTIPTLLLRTDLAICTTCACEENLNITHILKCNAICPIHSQVLIEQCPKCLEPLSWDLLDDYRCECGFDLKSSLPVPGDPSSARRILKALKEQDSSFFSRLLDAYIALTGLITKKNKHMINSCILDLTEGNRGRFVAAVNKIHDFYPCLSMRALLAPIWLSKSVTLEKHAERYYANCHQLAPSSHDQNCDCSELGFRMRELKFIFGQDSNLGALILEGEITTSHRKDVGLHNVRNLCEILRTRSDHWSDTESYPEIKDLNDSLSATEASLILRTSPYNIIMFMRSGLIPYKTGVQGKPLITYKSIEEFQERYILRTELLRCIRSRADHKVYDIAYTLPSLYVRPYKGIKASIVFERIHLPEALKEYKTYKASPLPRDGNNEANMLISRKTIGRYFPQLSFKYVIWLIKLGLIKTEAPTRSFSTRGLRPKHYYSSTSIQTAIEWINSHVTLEQLAKELATSPKRLKSLYLNTQYTEALTLTNMAIFNLTNANRIRTHFLSYLTIPRIQSQTKLPHNLIIAAIQSGALKPLSANHPDYLPGIILYPTSDCKAEAQKYFTAERIQKIVVRRLK
ncbi:hypothetical protein [Pseudomonas xanthosomatis]|uniref:hypothetical protein n=1 Tax=Pseudomonas xanthosomatis TaxID=2842356 RepID=UPI0035112CD9